MMPQKAVFLDRDGTINEEVDHLSHPDQFVLLPNSAQAIRLLNDGGFKVIVTTNQAGVARGIFSEEMVHLVNRKMTEELTREGAVLDGIYYCPHHSDLGEEKYRKNCSCRKPLPGMLLRAAKEMNIIALEESFAIGDTEKDILAGKAAGCRTILVLTGYGKDEAGKVSQIVDYIAEDLLDAANWILSNAKTEEI